MNDLLGTTSSYLRVVVHESWLSGESDPEDDVAESSPRQQEDSISSDRAGQQHLERVWDFSGWGRHGFGMTRMTLQSATTVPIMDAHGALCNIK